MTLNEMYKLQVDSHTSTPTREIPAYSQLSLKFYIDQSSIHVSASMHHQSITFA